MVSTASLPNWSYTIFNNDETKIWTHNTSYYIWIQATDLPGNVQTSFAVGTSSNSFTYDIEVPIGGDCNSSNNGYYNATTNTPGEYFRDGGRRIVLLRTG